MNVKKDRLPSHGLARPRHNERQRRVTRACDACQRRRIKCNGTTPTCERCQALGDKSRIKAARYEEFLQELSRNVDEHNKTKIRAILETSERHVPRRQRSRSSSSKSPSPFIKPPKEREITEDLNRSHESQATGYMGTTSGVSWLCQLEDGETAQDRRKDGGPFSAVAELPREMTTTSSASYHLDNVNIGQVEGDPVEAFILPPKDVSDKLLQSYLESVHDSFPIFNKQLFTEQFNTLYSRSSSRPGKRWLAILNMVFAIGSKVCRLTKPDVQRDVQSNIFFTKARALSVGRNVIFEHADLQQVQLESLVAFYLLIVVQINRGWKMIGIAARSGNAMGINLRNTSLNVTSISKASRYRLWGSIFYLEHLFSVITGRPSSLVHTSSSVLPPAPVEEGTYDLPSVRQLLHDHKYHEHYLHGMLGGEDTQILINRPLLNSVGYSSSLYFYYQMDLAKITSAVIEGFGTDNDDFFAPGWGQVENQFTVHKGRLNAWLSSLAPPFRFTNEQGRRLPVLEAHYQISLAMHYYSTLVVLSQPCLTRPGFNAKTGILYPRSQFGNDTALVCLQSALNLTSILPDTPDPIWFFKMTPWWCALQFVVQGATILLVHMSIGPVSVRAKNGEVPGEGASGTTESPEIVLAAIQKNLSWLHSLSEYDASAHRAFGICNRLFHRIACRHRSDVNNVHSISAALERQAEEQRRQTSQQISMLRKEKGGQSTSNKPEDDERRDSYIESNSNLAELDLEINSGIWPLLGTSLGLLSPILTDLSPSFSELDEDEVQ